MYSFNLDYIFNFVYNIFLAIRYVIVFWILRITPEEYLSDHQYQAWDGLRDRGWISTSTQITTQNTDGVVYLGQVASDHHSKVSEITQQVKSVPWFSGLHFSIQNPILAFLADVLSVLTFFVILLLIYILFRYLMIILSPINEEKEKRREEKLQAKINQINERNKQNQINREREKSDRINLEKETREKLENSSSKEEKIHTKIEESKVKNILEEMPAGIPNLPIDKSDLSKSEIKDIQADNNLLLNYQVKNYVKEKENKILKVISKNNIKEREDDNKNIIEMRAIPIQDIEENLNQDKRKNWYEERWQIILGYMKGSEDALIRIGIIEADNLLDTILTDKGYIGNTLSDKLSQANFKSIDLAWSAHKTRNRIAHDGMNFVLTERIAKQTIESFRVIFKELKAID